MTNIIHKAHSGIAYIALFLLLITVINCIMGLISKRDFKEKDKKIALFALIFTHIQLLIGLITWGVIELPIILNAGSEIMKNPVLRLASIEHPLINIIAVVLITIGWSKHKKADTSSKKFKTLAIFYGLGLLLILSRIPWKLWL